MKPQVRRWATASLAAAAAVTVLMVDLGRAPDPLWEIRALRIEDAGRVRSFEAFAARRWVAIAGPGAVGDPVAAVLAIAADPDSWRRRPAVWLTSPQLRQTLGLPATMSHASAEALQQEERFGHLLARAVTHRVQGEPLSPLEREGLELYGRLALVQELAQQELRLIAAPDPSSSGWLPVLQPDGYPVAQQVSAKRAWSALLGAVHRGQPETMQAASHRFASMMAALGGAGRAHAAPASPIRSIGVLAVVAVALMAAWAYLVAMARVVVMLGRDSPSTLRRGLRHQPQPSARVAASLARRVQAVCWDHARPGPFDPDTDCQIARRAPVLAGLAARAGSETFGGFAGSVEQVICASCEHMGADGRCLRRERGDCCLNRYLPLVYQALEQAEAAKTLEDAPLG